MIIDIVIYFFAFALGLLATILPSWQPWNAEVISGINDFVSSIYILNIIIDVAAVCKIVLFWSYFLPGYFFIKKVVLPVANYFRGSEGLKI